MDKNEYVINAMNRFLKLSKLILNKNIEIDYDKIRWLTEEWLERNNKVDVIMLNDFCNNLETIVKEEIILREKSNNQNSIWLTK